MKSLANIIALSGVLAVALVVALVMGIWNSDGPPGHNQVGAAFFALVLGLPALGFLIVTGLVGGFLSLIGAARSQGSNTRMQAVRDAQTDPFHAYQGLTEDHPTAPKRPGHPFLSLVGFWFAVLWSTPCGLFTFILFITGDSQKLISAILIWILGVAPALALHIWFKPIR